LGCPGYKGVCFACLNRSSVRFCRGDAQLWVDTYGCPYYVGDKSGQWGYVGGTVCDGYRCDAVHGQRGDR
jgi:hypothetical protein